MIKLRHSGIMLMLCGLLCVFSQSLFAQTRTVDSQAGKITVEQVASLSHPWGLAFLPDGRMLITERGGKLWIVTAKGEKQGPVQGVPQVYAQGQGGLLGIAIDPDFKTNQLVYLAFSEPGQGGASTALGRGKLNGDKLQDFKVLFSQQPKFADGRHFGGRIVISGNKLFLTTGERGQGEPSQDLKTGLGKIIRLNLDGSAPSDNPFANKTDAIPGIWSYGHRNVLAAALHPLTGALWIAEMGPMGGDELNLPKPGLNYGWPHVSWGKQYSGEPIPKPSTRPEFEDSIHQWTPVISPSGMAFYTGNLFKDWRGDMLIGSLSRLGLVRLKIENNRVAKEEVIPLSARIRDVVQGADGALYLLTDHVDGALLKLTPQK